MKLSLRWIFDHISDANWMDINPKELSRQLTATTVEIERVLPIRINLDALSIGQVIEHSAEKVTVFSTEWNKNFEFQSRPVNTGDQYLITKNGWATYPEVTGISDSKFGSQFFPTIYVTDDELPGEWKKKFEHEDYLISIDNNAITHRGDLWSHRGFAREVAATFGLKFKDINHLITVLPIEEDLQEATATPARPFSFEIGSKNVKRFAGLYVPHIELAPSLLPIAHRLARIDGRPIDAIVDATNYVMFDIGQPMHAFDAQKIKTKKILATEATGNEKLTLLDSSSIDLIPGDIVISDGRTPLGLAGIMGGANSGIDGNSQTVVLEAACFDSTAIRNTAARVKIRSEASVRFEKGVDPNLNVYAIQRFVHLFEESPLSIKLSGAMICLGKPIKPPVIELAHAHIEAKIGIQITKERVEQILTRLGFEVRTDRGLYSVTIPSWRLRDIAIAEDLVEEIARFYGYSNITPVLPAIATAPHDVSEKLKKRIVKRHLSFSYGMHELRNYALYDTEFLHKIGWQPSAEQQIALKNPVSEHWQWLVTSLVPGLLKAAMHNEHTEDRLRFYELNKTWSKSPTLQERRTVACLIYDRHKKFEFYELKKLLTELFHKLDVTAEWARAHESDYPFPWKHKYQTAQLTSEGKLLGYAGKVDIGFLNHLLPGDAAFFELDLSLLVAPSVVTKRMQPLPKYPTVRHDISMFVPASINVAHLENTIRHVDARIVDVSLIDMFEKDKKALTFRYVIQDQTKTLEKEEIESISNKVQDAVKKLGVEIR